MYDYTDYKYKIEECMQALNVEQYSMAIKLIPPALDISPNTFHNYRHLKLDSKSDIPYILVRRLENIFNLKRGGLENFSLEFKSLPALIKEYKGLC